MTQHVQLNNVDHSGLRVRTDRTAELGDQLMLAPVFPHELRNVQAAYPIVFIKDASSGGFRPVSLFGFEDGQNLFLGENGWDASYIPLAVRMKPFLIGVTSDETGQKRMEVHVDLDHPRVSNDEGEPLFLDHGGHAPLLQEVTAVLEEVHTGEQSVGIFSSRLDELDLLEPFTLDITLNDGSQGRLAGYYTIAEEKLYSLDAETLGQLQEQGMLQPIYMAVASVSQFRNLIDRRNRLIEKG